MNTSFDLVVIGHGAAGLAAAVTYLESADADAHVAVLERSTREQRGGATRWTGAFLRIDNEHNFDDTYSDRLTETSGGRADLDYLHILHKDTPAAITFLQDRGVEISFNEFPFPHTFVSGQPSMAAPASPIGGGASIVESLSALLESDSRVDLQYQTEALSLLTTDGVVTGVRVRTPQGQRDLTGSAVVLANGGFEGNPEMLTRYIGPRAWELPLIAPGIANNRGDALRMALEVGADTAGAFDGIHAEPVDRRSTSADAVLYGFPAGIFVNDHAERFIDEGKDTWDNTFEKVGYSIWAHQNQSAYWIGDATSVDLPWFERALLSDVPPVTSNTIEDLAEQLGLEPAALTATISQFNAATNDVTFDHTRFDGKRTEGLTIDKSNWATPIDTAPYIGFPLTAALCFTYGGIRTDPDARVLTPSGTPIPGLFAAGEATGLYYSEYPPATSVLRSVVFGRRAGASILNQ